MAADATGGVQWQHVEATVNCAANTCGIGLLGGFPPGAPYLQTNDTTRTGWAIGGGVETMLPGKWLLRGEYRYADSAPGRPPLAARRSS